MKIKTSELEGDALNWMVAKVLGADVYVDRYPIRISDGRHPICWDAYETEDGCNADCNPSGDWTQGGPLIERYKIHLFIQQTAKGMYGAGIPEVCRFASESYLVSAMRAIVAFEMGDEVDVPEELAGGAR